VKALQTEALWAKQNQHEDDRLRLFRAIGRIVEATSVLYPGSYVDIAPSMAFATVTYVDVDNRAQRFFGDAAGVRDIVVCQPGAPSDPEIAFVHSGYTNALPLDEHSFDLLVSLYAGFISEHCTDHLKIGGTLLAKPSHGDAAMASVDPRYQLSGSWSLGPATTPSAPLSSTRTSCRRSRSRSPQTCCTRWAGYRVHHVTVRLPLHSSE
jgi:hypothetical protein